MPVGGDDTVGGEMTPLANALGRALGELPDEEGRVVEFTRPPASRRSSGKRHIDDKQAEQVQALYRLLGVQELRKIEEEGFKREHIREVAGALALDMVSRILGGEFKVKDAEQAAKIAQIMVNIMRLESGQATSKVETTVSGDDERKRRFIELRDKITGTLGEADPG